MGQVIPLPTPLPEWLDPELWTDWISHRMELGKPLTPTGERRCLKKLERWHEMGVDLDAQIDHAIEARWRGLYLTDLTPHVNGKPAKMLSDEELLTACAAKGIGTKGRSRHELERLV